MTIDARTGLGRKLDVGNPAELDLSQPGNAAGELIAERIAGGTSRDEVIIGLLNHAAKLAADNVVSLNVDAIVSARPEVGAAIEAAQRSATQRGRKESVAQSITRLIIAGARPKEERKDRTDSMDSFEAIMESVQGIIKRRR